MKQNKDNNCLETCFKNVYGISIEGFDIEDNNDWMFELSSWLSKEYNKSVVPCKIDLDDLGILNNSLIITCINHGDGRHAVVSKGSKIIFDPLKGQVYFTIKENMQPTFLIIFDSTKEGDHVTIGQ